jgi:hypothetical protein
MILESPRNRAALAIAIVGLSVGLAGPAGASRPAAGVQSTPPSLGGWNISANGNVVDILVDNATGLAGVHPLSEADFPEAESDFQTGPFGTGLATVFWPGSAGGNFGSLSSQLGFPSQLQPLASQLNDPIKASTSYPTGPTTSRYPAGSSGGAAVMQSTAGPGGTTAEGAVNDQTPSGAVLAFSQAKGISSAVASNTATATASTNLSDVKLIGGLIDIGSITSTATATSNGSTGTGSASTAVGAVTVLGQPTSIGSNGLVIPNFPSSLGVITGPIVQNALSQVISGLGLTITEFPATQEAKGAGFSASSGGVSIGINPPSSAAPTLEQAASVLAPLFPSQAAIIPTLPGLLQGAKVTITLGRASASANASPAFVSNFTPPPFTAPPASSSGGSVPISSAGGSPVSATSPGAVSTGGNTLQNSGGTNTGGNSTASLPPPSLISVSSPLHPGPVVFGTAIALLFGFGLWMLARMLLPKDFEPVCPLGQDRP